MPKGYPKDPESTRIKKSLAGSRRTHTEEEKQKIGDANRRPHPWAKGKSHPPDCNHCVALKERITREKKDGTYNLKIKGKSHPPDCNHCKSARGKNPTKGRSGRILPYIGPPILCTNGCGKRVWPRGMHIHLQFCDGTTHDGEEGYGLYWNCIRKFIYRRDGYICQGCGKSGSKDKKDIVLVAHHIMPYRKVQDHSEPNLITLCRGCHQGWHNYDNIVEGRKPNVH